MSCFRKKNKRSLLKAENNYDFFLYEIISYSTNKKANATATDRELSNMYETTTTLKVNQLIRLSCICLCVCVCVCMKGEKFISSIWNGME